MMGIVRKRVREMVIGEKDIDGYEEEERSSEGFKCLGVFDISIFSKIGNGE